MRQTGFEPTFTPLQKLLVASALLSPFPVATTDHKSIAGAHPHDSRSHFPQFPWLLTQSHKDPGILYSLTSTLLCLTP